MRKKSAKQIISEITQSYDDIAQHFSDTRYAFWPELKNYIEPYFKPNQQILDLGCGNGRLLEILPPDCVYLGIDISKSLIALAQEKHPNQIFITKNITEHSAPDNTYDIVFAIASFHHLPHEAMRQKLLSDIYHYLKPNGYLIMTNWFLWQEKYQPYFYDQNNTQIPWKNSQGEQLASRYYHAFTDNEIDTLLKNNKFDIILNKRIKNNILTVATK